MVYCTYFPSSCPVVNYSGWIFVTDKCHITRLPSVIHLFSANSKKRITCVQNILEIAHPKLSNMRCKISNTIAVFSAMPLMHHHTAIIVIIKLYMCVTQWRLMMMLKVPSFLTSS